MLRHFAIFVMLGLIAGCGASEPTGGSPVAVALQFITEPSAAAAGAQISPTVRVGGIDDDGAVVAGYSGLITLGLTGGAPGAELLGTLSAAAVAGIASFPLAAVDLPGSGFQLVATASGLESATSVAFAIAGPHLAFVGIPTGAPASEPLSGVEVEARNAQGQLVTAFSGEVTVALSSSTSGAVLGGTPTVSAVGGRATFTDLTVSKPGSGYTLVATTAEFVGATSGVFAVTSPPATMLAFSTGPTNTMARHPFPTLTVEALDSRGERATSYNGTVTIALRDNLAGGALLGTTTATAVTGIVRFQGLSITLAGSGYTLEASASQLEPATSAPVDIAPLVFVQLSGGDVHTCGVSTVGAGFCWGEGLNGEIGDGQRSSRSAPTVVSADVVWRKIEASFKTSCGLSTAGAVYCWGRSPVHGTPSGIPQLVSGAIVFDSLTVGGHVCGLTSTGSAYCWGTTGWGYPGWGNNDWGQLGDGTFVSRTTPTPVAGGLTFQSLSAGTEYTCGVTTAGAAYCWGYNGGHQLGDGTVQESPVPIAVRGGLNFRFVRGGTSHTCGITTDGAAYCWYGSVSAYLGGSTLTVLPPVPVSGGLTFTDIDVGTTHSSGERHSCAVATGGSVYCWGQSGDGNLGDGTTRPFVRASPGLVSGPHTYAAITAGTNSASDFIPRHTCALTTTGAAMCWGSNNRGQIGDGTITPRTTPTAVLGSVP